MKAKMFVKHKGRVVYKVWEDNSYHAASTFQTIFDITEFGGLRLYGSSLHRENVEIVIPKEFI